MSHRLKNDVIVDGVCKGLYVSTIFLGAGYNLVVPPLCYETMIFNADEAIYCKRYSELIEALEGHDKIIRKLSVATSLENIQEILGD